MENRVRAQDLLRLAGGVAYWRGVYFALDGLARRLRVSGDTLSGSFLCIERYRVRLQLVPPFTNKCSCPKGGNCTHVVALGLTFLDEERQKPAGPPLPAEENCYYLVTMLDHTDLRGLAMELLAAVPEATPVAIKYLDRPGHFREWDAYVLDWESEEEG